SRRRLLPILSDLFERSAVTVEHGLLTGVFLTSPNDAVSVFRIDLNQSRLAIAPFAGYQRTAGAAKQIRNHVADLAAVEQRTLDQLHRFRSWMNPIRGGPLFCSQR